jgi:hypothetical protein
MTQVVNRAPPLNKKKKNTTITWHQSRAKTRFNITEIVIALMLPLAGCGIFLI